jgi:hypothetical protein
MGGPALGLGLARIFGRLALFPQLEGQRSEGQFARMAPGHAPPALAEQQAADQGGEFGKWHGGLLGGDNAGQRRGFSAGSPGRRNPAAETEPPE